MSTRLYTFAGGTSGPWRVASMQTMAGEPLAAVDNLAIVGGSLVAVPQNAGWQLSGITSNARYVKRTEKRLLVAKQPSLGRAEATCAACCL